MTVAELQLDSVPCVLPYHIIYLFLFPVHIVVSKKKKKGRGKWILNVVLLRQSGKALCLLCSDTITVLQEYNILYIGIAKDILIIIFPTHRKATVKKIENLKWNILSQQNFLPKIKENEATINLQVAYLLANQEKLFNDGECLQQWHKCVQREKLS